MQDTRRYACLLYTSKLTKAQSMYHDSLAFGPRSTFDKPLAQVQLQDVARKDPPEIGRAHV